MVYFNLLCQDCPRCTDQEDGKIQSHSTPAVKEEQTLHPHRHYGHRSFTKIKCLTDHFVIHGGNDSPVVISQSGLIVVLYIFNDLETHELIIT